MNIDTYVINMDHNIDRMEKFDKTMKGLNWKYNRFSGINGKLASKDETSKYFTRIRALSKGEIGCALSHIKLWEKLLEGNSERMLIFEDDSITHITGDTLKDTLLGFYKYLQENNTPEPDMLYLGKSMDRCDKYEHVWKNVYKSKGPLCLHAYIITRRGAKALLEMAPYSLPIDMYPAKAAKRKNVNVMAFHHSIFFQDVINTTSNMKTTPSSISIGCECFSPWLSGCG